MGEWGTDLHKAVRWGELDRVKRLIEEGADTDATDDCGRTALYEACYKGSLEMVKYLCEEAGANIAITDKDGRTALHEAARGNNIDVVRYLCEEAGADKEATDKDGLTPRDVAKRTTVSQTVVEYLPAREFPWLLVAAVGLAVGIGTLVYMKRK